MLLPFCSKSLLTTFLFLAVLLSFSQNASNHSVIAEIRVIGNKVTKENIVLRELPFKLGDTVLTSAIPRLFERAESNLFNTSLFNFITLEKNELRGSSIAVHIILEERWYWWPSPIFEVEENNFNTWWKTKNLDRANYGLFLSKENFRGRKERILFKLQFGYTEKVGLEYSIPYINSKNTQGLTVSFSHNRNHEVIYGTTNNLRDFYRIDSVFAKRENVAKLKYSLRPKLYNTHSLELRYTSLNIIDSILRRNPNFLWQNNASYFSLTYLFKKDKRNNKAYPTKGHYYDLKLMQDGLGILNTNKSVLSMTTGYRQFFQLTPRLYFSSSLKGRITFTSSPTPFYLLEGFGDYNNLVRGYELYVINGENYGLFKSQLRLALLDNKLFQLNTMESLHKFNKVPLSIFLGMFFDAGHVTSKESKEMNPLNNKMLYGTGVSLDFVSYYDLVFRMEYTVNRLGENALFLHFIAPI